MQQQVQPRHRGGEPSDILSDAVAVTVWVIGGVGETGVKRNSFHLFNAVAKSILCKLIISSPQQILEPCREMGHETFQKQTFIFNDISP